MDVQLGVPSASISWWTIKIPRCPSRRVGELLQTPLPNSCSNLQGQCIGGKAAPAASDTTLSHVLQTKEEKHHTSCRVTLSDAGGASGRMKQ